jgi:hypothetical protein
MKPNRVTLTGGANKIDCSTLSLISPLKLIRPRHAIQAKTRIFSLILHLKQIQYLTGNYKFVSPSEVIVRFTSDFSKKRLYLPWEFSFEILKGNQLYFVLWSG